MQSVTIVPPHTDFGSSHTARLYQFVDDINEEEIENLSADDKVTIKFPAEGHILLSAKFINNIVKLLVNIYGDKQAVYANTIIEVPKMFKTSIVITMFKEFKKVKWVV